MSSEINTIIDSLRERNAMLITQYSHNLVQRHTPRLNQVREEDGKREELAEEFDRSKQVTQQLTSAYAEQVERNRKKHTDRMSKFRNYHAPSSLPESQGSEEMPRKQSH